MRWSMLSHRHHPSKECGNCQCLIQLCRFNTPLHRPSRLISPPMDRLGWWMANGFTREMANRGSPARCGAWGGGQRISILGRMGFWTPCTAKTAIPLMLGGNPLLCRHRNHRANENITRYQCPNLVVGRRTDARPQSAGFAGQSRAHCLGYGGFDLGDYAEMADW